ncbi:MAG: DNRLRE domain-containing protein, partial [Prevotellaceae bacterium]|nr:DNRLRE domain-containing protein [Prevotellaceae bacterium]
MKKILLSIILFFSAAALFAQATAGRDFWVAFGLNGLNTSGEQYHLQMKIVTENSANLQLNFTDNTSLNRAISIPANTIYSLTFSTQECNAIRNAASGASSSNKSLHITSDKPIVIYISDTKAGSSEATQIFPVERLGNDYYQIAYLPPTHPHPTYVNQQGDGYVIVATQNNTQIRENGTLLTTINAGEVFSKHVPHTDLTGFHITSSNPVAYFVNTTNAFVPVSSDGWADMLFEQLTPVLAWGTSYFVPVTNRGKDRVRIVASQNGTNITQTGGTIMSGSLNLSAGQFVELEINQANKGCYISANNPVEVYSYMVSWNEITNPSYYSLGDPSLVRVEPISEMTAREVGVSPFIDVISPQVISSHFALIVTPTATKNNTTILTTASMPAIVWTDNIASGLSYANITLVSSATSYFFQNANGISVYGYGLGGSASYCYLAAAVDEDEIIPAKYIACPNAVVKVSVPTQAGTSFYWYNAATGGTPFASNTNEVSVTKNSSAVQTVYVEPRQGSTVLPRIAIDIELSDNCGQTNPTGCAATGTILFKEDFGGNSPSDPAVKATGIPQVLGHTYNPIGYDGTYFSVYSIRKEGATLPWGGWVAIDDHTFPNDKTRGYFIQFDAAPQRGVYYQRQIDNLYSNTNLFLSLWLTSVRDSDRPDKVNQIFIVEDLNGNVLTQYFTGDIPDCNPVWKNYGVAFTIPSGQSSIILKIYNNSTGSTGNDFALDDIEIRLCDDEPVLQKYIACPNAVVKVSVPTQAGTNFYWYNTATSGTPFASNINEVSVTKNSSAVQTVYVEPRQGSTVMPRIAIDIELSDNCGQTNPTGCAATGTILFKEDFGGNSPSDPVAKPTGIPQVSGLSYDPTAYGDPCYALVKQTPNTHTASWYDFDDHTYPNDFMRGYYLLVASGANLNEIFYQTQINNLQVGSKLYISAWIASLVKVAEPWLVDFANVRFVVESAVSGSVLANYYTGNIPDLDPNWKIYGFEFITPETSIVVKIYNNCATGTSGNDLILDDIEVRLCEENNDSVIACTQAYYTTADAPVACRQPADSQNTSNKGNQNYVVSDIWTWSGTPGIERFYLNFDLSDFNLTSNSQIANADLYLFGIDFRGNASNKTNKHVFNRVTQAWGEYTITWNNQPTIDATTSMITPHISGTMDNPAYWVNYVFSMNNILINGGGLYANYNGISCRPYQENINDYYRLMTFASKEYSDQTKHPYLKVEYETPMPEITVECEKIYVSRNEDLEILFDNVQYIWTVNGVEYVGDTITTGLSGSLNVTLHIIITNNLGEVCDYFIEKNDVLPAIRTTVYDDMCAGHQYPICGCIWEDGTHYVDDTLVAQNGCDSIVTHVVTVLPRETNTINATICNGKSYDFYGAIITDAGTYKDTVNATSGCDTIVTLNLIVEDCDKIEINPIGEICADDEFILLTYSVLEGGLDCYSVKFNQKAKNEGFLDIDCEIASGGTIEIPIPQKPSPQYVLPDYDYSFTISFELSDGTIENHTFTFDIFYPAWIMEQNWNDVIALQNDRYNGGYKWSAYEWYLNGAQIPNETQSYIYIKNGGILAMGQEYRALLTRVSDG